MCKQLIKTEMLLNYSRFVTPFLHYEYKTVNTVEEHNDWANVRNKEY
jgi:hypothetical protein